jgi:hypothetical protein
MVDSKHVTRSGRKLGWRLEIDCRQLNREVKLFQFAPLVFCDVPENYELKLWFLCMQDGRNRL